MDELRNEECKKMVSKKFIIKNDQGLHSRPANTFVKECVRYDCDIKLIRSGQECNAKSILQILTACIKQGHEVEIICSGKDENQAMSGITALIETGLG